VALVDIDDGLKKEVERAIVKNNVEYPTIKNFCDKAIKKQLDSIRRINKWKGKCD
jgi:hypothetical protein